MDMARIKIFESMRNRDERETCFPEKSASLTEKRRNYDGER